MADLIGIPEAARILGRTRQAIWHDYKNGRLQALAVMGTEAHPQPIFLKSYIEGLLPAYAIWGGSGKLGKARAARGEGTPYRYEGEAATDVTDTEEMPETATEGEGG